MNRGKRVLLGLLTAVVWLLFPLLAVGVGYGTFVLPAKVETWKSQGRELSTVDQVLIDLSDLCKARWFIVLPILFILAIGTTAWFLASLRSRSK